MSNFGENLKRIRSKKNISQGELAQMLDIHATHVSRYERNLTLPSVEVVKKIADILEVSTDDLIYGVDDEKVKQMIEDTELLSMFKKVQGFEEEEQICVKTMLKAFIFQKDMKKQLLSQSN